jgi:hypothetical protein
MAAASAPRLLQSYEESPPDIVRTQLVFHVPSQKHLSSPPKADISFAIYTGHIICYDNGEGLPVNGEGLPCARWGNYVTFPATWESIGTGRNPHQDLIAPTS